ncbi:hypothetical protein [Dactylosporangium sp. CS-033363]|uniref:hypothetical protein n=1 Tax=Dactylosporangium sp. CS-033363 TaxID=3239935 RepID=UPI003D8F460C
MPASGAPGSGPSAFGGAASGAAGSGAPVVSGPPASVPPGSAQSSDGWPTPEPGTSPWTGAPAGQPVGEEAAATGAIAYSRGASSPPPAEDAPPAWPVPAPDSPAAPVADAPGMTPSGSWPVVPAPGSSAQVEDTEATRPINTSVGLPSRAARGPADEERSILDGPSFDGFAVSSRPGREEETEAFHPGSQSPVPPRPRHAAPGTGEYSVVTNADDPDRRPRFQPMAPQPVDEDRTTALRAPVDDGEATTIIRQADPAPTSPATRDTTSGTSTDTAAATETATDSPADASPAEDDVAGSDEATTLWPYGGATQSSNQSAANDEATTRFEAPVEDADATANFGFGDGGLTPEEAAERRAAFARGEAERRATAAQSQLDRIASERAAAQQDDEEQPPPKRDNPPTSPWADPPRDRS